MTSVTRVHRDPEGRKLARSPEKSRPSFLWPLAGLVKPLTVPLFRLDIRDAYKLPRSGPFILAPNHYSEIDPIVVALAVWKIGRAPRFMAKAGLFKNPVLGWILRSAGQIPVERMGSTRGNDPISAAGRLVETGQGVIIYPEGTLTREPNLWPMRGKTGVARMALTHNLPVYPMAHWGTQEVMPRYGKKISLFPRKNIKIVIGDPVNLDEFLGKHQDSTVLHGATEQVMVAITSLLETLREEEAPAERWDPSKHNQTETGRFDEA
ncbi:lysophospholipid acyltransferase family protein [Mycetocola tolaasinivorans]|uniref:lysophospholipid acyltransferase family protein n=1 Tax=Mycetocola tolaasinivorans TaxID=76635 RepID=UPI001FE9BBA9|nr:lysophospholipid acyltransferase family protein [Mycetocola tolaasinivorans]